MPKVQEATDWGRVGTMKSNFKTKAKSMLDERAGIQS